MNTIVVRPSERPKVLEQGKLSYEQIKAERVAPGFIASISRANSCGQIIVVKSDGTQAFAAPIESVVASDMKGAATRASISFGKPTPIKEGSIPGVVSGIRWNQKNLRYLDVEQLF
ncbi:hypothetical protein OJ996_05515 [Luteolibacter sp. GHJ8]|uniref:Uncharacterized protein n=1 Tax=Luteolibacter rhizosphaerae TaxID=2989719 RepID=A0ABT3FZJ9_9BACT|nr:hypothetical protein [Luteolibacter rhizosphaerae]MCW1913018.1 hypothetical protein [Luteolibacter rhizosphaerae]